MSTTAERGRRVRERLTGAAAELIAERGWAAVSTRMVAERAGVGPGLVHYHFPSLDALLIEAGTGVLRSVAEQAAARLETAATAEAGIALVLSDMERYPGDDPASRLAAEVYLAAARHPDLGRAVAEILTLFRERLAAWLTAVGVRDPESTAVVLGAALDGVMLHRPLAPGLTPDALEPVLLRLLVPAPDAGEGR